jgi:hypothetical protein
MSPREAQDAHFRELREQRAAESADLSADSGPTLDTSADVLEDMCVSLAMQAWQHHVEALQARHAFETGLAGLRKRLADASKIIEQQGALIDDLRIELACRMEPK